MPIVRKNSRKESAPRILCEKKVYFLGKWNASGNDIDHLRTQTKEFILEIPSKGGHKCKLRITTRGLTYSVERHNFFYGKHKDIDRIPLPDIKRFSVDDRYLHIIVAIVQISADKFRLLVFRCQNDHDCKELVDSYNMLVDHSMSGDNNNFSWAWKEDQSDVSTIAPSVYGGVGSTSTLQTQYNRPWMNRMSKSNGDIYSASSQRVEIHPEIHRDTTMDKKSKKESRAIKVNPMSQDYHDGRRRNRDMYAKVDKKRSKSMEILDAFDDSAYDHRAAVNRRSSIDLHNEREVLDHLDSMIDESSGDVAEDKRWVRDVGCQVEVEGVPLGPKYVQVETSTYIDPSLNHLANQFKEIEVRSEEDLGGSRYHEASSGMYTIQRENGHLSTLQRKNRDLEIPISHLDNRPPAPLPADNMILTNRATGSNATREHTTSRSYQKSHSNTVNDQYGNHVTENNVSRNPNVRLIGVTGSGAATLERGHGAASHYSAGGYQQASSSHHGGNFISRGGSHDGNARREANQQVYHSSHDDLDGHNHLVYGVNGGGPRRIQRAASTNVYVHGGGIAESIRQPPVIIEPSHAQQHVNFDERTLHRNQKHAGTIDRRIEDVYGHGRYDTRPVHHNEVRYVARSPPPTGSVIYGNGDVKRGYHQQGGLYESGPGYYTVDRRQMRKDHGNHHVPVRRSASVERGAYMHR